MSYEVSREYAHRTHGKIGNAKLEVTDKGKLVLDGKELPNVSAQYLLTFALQSLQDAYAGASNLSEAVGAFETKRDKVLAGTIGVRSGGSATTERDKVARIIVGDWFRNVFAKDNPEHEKLIAYARAESQSDKYAILDAIWADNEEAFGPAVDEEIERRKAKFESAKAIKLNI